MSGNNNLNSFANNNGFNSIGGLSSIGGGNANPLLRGSLKSIGYGTTNANNGFSNGHNEMSGSHDFIDNGYQ